MKNFASFLFLFLLVVSANAQKTVSDLDSIHQTVLNNWLKTKKGWRLALEKDFDQQRLKDLRADENRRPFYVAEDFNGDRKKDFAVILINSRKRFSAAVFNAPFNLKKIQQPAFFANPVEPDDIVYYNRYSKRLLIGPYESDAGIVLEPSGKGYKAEYMNPEN